MKADLVKRLKELEQENARLRRIVADQVLEVARDDHSTVQQAWEPELWSRRN